MLLNLTFCRYRNILPYDYNCVKLGITNQDEGYINASWIKTAGIYNFIAAQGPLPHTVSQFWQMVAESNVTVIIALTKMTEKDINGTHMSLNIVNALFYVSSCLFQEKMFPSAPSTGHIWSWRKSLEP